MNTLEVVSAYMEGFNCAKSLSPTGSTLFSFVSEASDGRSYDTIFEVTSDGRLLVRVWVDLPDGISEENMRRGLELANQDLSSGALGIFFALEDGAKVVASVAGIPEIVDYSIISCRLLAAQQALMKLEDFWPKYEARL